MAVARCVQDQEKLERVIPMAIYAGVVGLPLVLNLVREKGGFSIVMLLGAGLCFIVARIVVNLVKKLILFPLANARYDRAASKLRSFLVRFATVSAGPFSWTIGGPGAMAISKDGEVLILDRSNGYEVLRIPCGQIADVKVKKFSQIVTETRHGGRTTLGGFGGALGAAYTVGGRSSAVTRSVEEYVLEIRYQAQRNGEVKTAVVPGGSDHRTVEELCALIKRLEA